MFSWFPFQNSVSISQMCQGDEDEPSPPRWNNIRATRPQWNHSVSAGVNLLDLVFVRDTASCKRAETVACRVFKVSELQVSPHVENSNRIPVQGSWPESSCDPLICAQRCPWPGPSGRRRSAGGAPLTLIICSPGQQRVDILFPCSFLRTYNGLAHLSWPHGQHFDLWATCFCD